MKITVSEMNIMQHNSRRGALQGSAAPERKNHNGFAGRLLMLLMLLGLVFSQAWGADIRYHIINNQGKECFRYVIKDHKDYPYSSVDKTKLCVHPWARSVVATKFRFYLTREEAVADANGTEGAYFSEGATISEVASGTTDFYVRYSMMSPDELAAAGFTYDPEGNMTYFVQIRERNAKGGKRRQVYYDETDSRFEFGSPGAKNKDIPDPDPNEEGGGAGNLQTDLQYRFRVASGDDPYNVYIYNGAAESLNAKGVLTVKDISRNNDQLAKERVSYETKIENYDPETTTTLQAFFFVAASADILDSNWSTQWMGKMFVVGAVGGKDYYMRDVGCPKAIGDHQPYVPYMLCANGLNVNGKYGNFEPDPGFQLQCFQSWRNYDKTSDNTSLVLFTPYEETHPVTYHIVNSADKSKDVLTIVQRHGPSSSFNLLKRDKLQRIGCTLSEEYYSDRDCAEGHKLAANATVGDSTDVYIPYTFNAEATKTATNLEFSTEDNPKWFSVDIRDNGNKLLTYDATNNVIDSRYGPTDAKRILQESQYAFIGDPYSFRVICKGADGKYAYLDPESITVYGSAAADNVRFTDSPTDNMDRWAMVEGTTSNKFQIFLRDAYAATKRAFWDALGGGGRIRMWTQTGNNAEIAASSNIRVTPAPEYDYTYNIVDNKGRIAIKYTVKQEVSHRLDGDYGHKAIPSAIYSPYIEGETLTFYKTYTAGTGAVSNPVTMLPNGNANTPTDIYVRYTNAKLSTRRYQLDGSKNYFMQLGEKYVIYNSGIKADPSRPSIEEEGKELKIWTLRNSDPYDVEVRNAGEGNHKLWDDTEIHFILMDGAGTAEGQVELLFANGADLSTPDNSRSLELSAENVIKATTVRENPNQQVIFYEAVLERTYRLLDKKGKILLEYESRELPNSGEDLGVLAKWVSPLVKEYHYWARSSFTLSGDTYTLRAGEGEIETPQGSTDGYIYVTYDVKTTEDDGFVDLDGRNSSTKYMYMLKFKNGESFQQEMNDQFRESSTTKSLYPSAGHATKAVYPYSNGEANFYIYGAEQWEEQQFVASSRTRWSWYLEGNDPYRTKISSFQTQTSQTVNGSTVNRHAYFRTYKPDGHNAYVTGSIADNTLVDDGSAPSDYMILGTKGDYKLVTSDELGTDNKGYEETNHRVVNSFEQYWKNNPTVLNQLYKHKELTDDKTDAGKKERADYAAELNTRDLTADEITYMTTVSSPNWHHYQAWANINSWTSTSSKKYQKTDHWFQTIRMDYKAENDYSASPVFDFERVDLNGVLVLIDSHGWEVARKPMGRLDNKTAKVKLDKEIRKYDSPMVEEYTFWTLFDKESGYHKYKPHTGESNDSKNSKAAGTGKSLTDYPEVKSNGMLQDIYVTYTVKPQYADTYKPDSIRSNTEVKTSFLIRQGGVLAKASFNDNGTEGNEADDTYSIVPDDAYISDIDAGSVSLTSTSKPEYFWCLRPNFDIDVEMGYYDVERPDHSIKAEKRDSVEGSYIKHTITSRNNNFDPYNVQIYSYKFPAKYFVTNAGNAVMQNHQHLEDTSPADDHTLSLGDNTTVKFTANVSDYDGSNIFSTNATFLVVQDEHGNMRLMPRFDHSRVINGFTTLTTPAAPQPEEDKKHPQSTWLLRPPAQVYIIVDNQGREALRYTSLNDGAPVIPAKYRSPLATNFGFYKTLEETGTDTHVYKLETLKDSITTFDAAGLSEGGTVYVRYKYNPAADTDGLLKGTWYHAKLNDADVEVATTGVIKKSLVVSPSDEDDEDDEEKKAHRWRFMESAGDDSDPYAVTLWNGTPATESSGNRYIVFRHSDYTDENRSYALMQAATYVADSYSFLDGGGEGAPAFAVQADYISGTAEVRPGTIDATKKLTLTPVLATDKLTYKIITKSGIVALTSDEESINDSYKLKLPEWMESPLMESNAYIFYSSAEYDSEKDTYTIKGQATTSPKSLDGDVVYVHYDYEKSKKAVTSFQMPDLTGLPYNYAPLDLSGKVMYTIGISSNDNGKMWSANTTTGAITQADIKAGTELTAPARLWRFTGNDPYEVTIQYPSISETAVLAARDPDPNAEYKNATNEVIKPNDRYPVVYVKEPGDGTFKNTTFMVLKANPNEVTTSNNRHRKGTLKFYLTGKDTQYLAESNSLAGGVYVYTDKDPDTGDDIHYKDRLVASGEPINPVDKILKPDDPMIIYSNFFYRPVLTYHVITNDKKEALKGYSLMEGTTVELPEIYQSPLLNSSDFTYYTKATVDGSDYTVDEKATTTASSTIASVVAKSIGDIYVRYKYDPATSPFKIATSIDDNADDGTRLDWINEAGLDLTGNTWYTIANMQRNWTSDEHGRVFGSETDNVTRFKTLAVTSLPNGRAPSQTEYLWKLEGKDPYAIRIYSAKHNKYLSVDNSNRNINLLDKDQAGNTQTFMLLEAYAHDNREYVMGGYELKRWTVLMTTGSNYFTPCTTTGSGLTSSLQARNTWVANNYADYQIRMSGSKVVTRKVYNMGSGGTTQYCIEFIKAPVSRKYHYHAIQYDGSGNKVGQTWDAILEHDWLQDVVLDEVIARQYCKYEKKSTTFYGTDNVNVTPTNEFVNRFTVKDTVQFYHDADFTERIRDVKSGKFDIYPEIGLDSVYHIYFKYQIDPEAQLSGRTLSDMTSTQAGIDADVAYYNDPNRGNGHMGVGYSQQAKWFFMVLDTDSAMTATGTGDKRTFTGNQYFLRREDNGTVSWMNNAYTLHKYDEDNYNNWSYNRLAEWYRKGDNDAYREGRWLWAFVGDDPYNMRIVNFESAVGVTAEGYNVYTLDGADKCYTTIRKNTSDAGIVSYPVTIPTSEPSENQYWGICVGVNNSEEETFSLLSTSITEETDDIMVSKPLYWHMVSRTANKVTTESVEGLLDYITGQSYAIQLLPYAPVKYQDINLVIKRDDHVADYTGTWKPAHPTATEDQKKAQLKTYDSGISLLYFTAAERTYVAGDKIDLRTEFSLPYNVRRAFCKYTLYQDDYKTPYDKDKEETWYYTVTDGPYPTTTQATTNGVWSGTGTSEDPYVYSGAGDRIYDEDGKPVWTYVDKDGKPASGAQSIYVKYEVTSDIFLKEAPRKDQVEAMAQNNDHVYFMDFPTYDSKGNEITHHAFYDPEATTFIQTGDLSKNKDKNTGIWVPEKKSWNESSKTYVSDFSNSYNNLQYRTVNDRMESTPDHLKWYFVGDPYKVQVFNTAGVWNTEALQDENGEVIKDSEAQDAYPANTVNAQLARYNPVETNFQFVSDCVHLRLPDYTKIDRREELVPTDEYGVAMPDKTFNNRNYNKPYINDFYWEVMPAASDETGTFALRFKEDNELMGYRNVYYYLAREGLTKSYQVEEENPDVYHINLSYNADNERYESGKYLGYHKANNENSTIKLVQPVKVYITANRVDDRFGNKENVVKDEYSGYYGLGETITGVPRHLQRKYVKYNDLSDKNGTTMGEHFLTEGNAYNYPLTECSVHSSNVFKTGTKINPVFKFSVNYSVDDQTAEGVHLFTKAADPTAPTQAEITWLDVKISNSSWLYYDKTNKDGSGVENKTDVVSNYRRAMNDPKNEGWNSEADGWNDGLKGLHWAFVGDPYDFTILNRRRYEDNTINTSPMWFAATKRAVDNYNGTATDSIVWTACLVNAPTATNTSTATAALTAGSGQNSHWSLQMWKTGGDSDFFLRTASLNQTEYTATPAENAPIADTETDNYWRMAARTSTISDTEYEFEAIPYSLSNKNRWTSNKGYLDWNTYVTNGTGYSKSSSGMGVKEQLIQIRTATNKDNDKADNNCFDAKIQIVTKKGVKRIEKDNLEIKYGIAADMLPYSLRRYGCTYECYINYVSPENPGTLLYRLRDSDVPMDEAESWSTSTQEFNDLTAAITTAKNAHENVTLTYVYDMQEDVAPYFTTEANALIDEYTWMNTYFEWEQIYTGTNVEVEYYEDVFDHYVYNAQGQIVDAVYVKERKTKIVKNPTTPYITDAFLNSHTTQTAIYADQSVQTEKDQQKWSLVGDPYSFKMINYDQYLKNQNSKLTLDGNNVVASNISSQNFDLAVDAKGNTYLGIFDGTGEDGNADVKHFINFTYSASSDKSLHYENAAVINDNDPTGNTLKTKNIKPFKLANLISYADVLQYHLIIAHQHSLDPEDAHLKDLSNTNDETYINTNFTSATDAQKTKYTADRNNLRNHLVEFLKYQEIRKKLTGDNKKYLNGTTSVAGDGTLWIPGREDDIKTLLKQEGSLRDFISYPVVDYNVSRVGIGNHPQVPWYMKRQFCKYYLYQRDVMRSVILDGTYDVNGNGKADSEDIHYAYLKNDNGEYVDYDGNVVDEGERIRLWMDEEQTKPAYEILWVSLFDKAKWSDWSTDDDADLAAGKIDASRKVEYPEGQNPKKYKKMPSGYVEGLSQQGQILTTLLPCHKNRKVVIDVVYEVNTDEFQFATSGRNTYAWYQMMTNNASSGMMNFSYKDGIGARTDIATHYTNNYLWAPEGDPYGFVLRSRYATVNGTGWDDVVVTTTGHLPKSTDYSTYDAATVITSDATAFDATYTRRVGNNGGNLFDNKLIIHHLGGEELATNDGPANAIYEMFTGDATYSNSFLMHPTSSYIDLTNTTFQSYYMAHDTQTHKAKLVAGSANTLKNDNDANWRLLTTPEQLWPFFEYSGYVGGLDPLVAQNFSNMALHTQLKEYIDNPSMEREYSVLNRARQLVYKGKFYKRSGGELTASDPRPTAAEDLPVTFVPENLVQMKEGYYRIRGFSTDKLKAAETNTGVYGPRYVSGYRFASEVTNNKPLRYFETDQTNATIHTFADLTAKKGFSDATPGAAVLQGNIELLPVEYDASSIFRFEALTDANSGVASDAFGRWVFGSQDLRVQVVGTPAENTPATTKMVAGTGTPFRLDDIGGATVTLRTLNGVPTNADATHTWDADENYDVSKNIRTNYLTSNGSNNGGAYSLVVGADNELNQTETTDIQDTKWMLQPIGIRTSWPFNQTPLRVEVKKGGKDKTDKDDKYYYGSLCVPFDSRLGKTTDAAFTLVREMTGQSGTITMPSVSQYNGMGNPQYVPATWPVVMRTNQPGKVQMKNADDSNYGGMRYYVDMYLPYTSPQTVSKASLNPLLMGEYLERTLDNTYMTGKTSGFTEPITSLSGKTIMVFGLPFKDHATDNHVYDTDAQVGWFKNHNWARETYHSVTANTATDTERNNLYVYNNKVYYVMNTPSAGARELIVALFDEDVEPREDEPIEDTASTKTVPWPCDVYDVQGRRVARHETPQTLLKNNPSLPKGVYIFGGRKVVVK